MADTQTAPAGAKVPVWFWIVAVILVLWNGYGVWDFIGTNFMADTYLQAYTPEQQAYFTGFPMWFTVIWAVAILTAFFGAVALLIRNPLAVSLSFASVVLYILASICSLFVLGGMAVMGMVGLIFTVVLFLILLAQFWVARWAVGRGILR